MTKGQEKEEREKDRKSERKSEREKERGELVETEDRAFFGMSRRRGGLHRCGSEVNDSTTRTVRSGMPIGGLSPARRGTSMRDGHRCGHQFSSKRSADKIRGLRVEDRVRKDGRLWLRSSRRSIWFGSDHKITILEECMMFGRDSFVKHTHYALK